MQYFATHYIQSANENAVSLVLQQAYHKRRRMPVLLACVCTESGRKWDCDMEVKRKVVASLADWFYGQGLELCGKNGEKGMDNITHSLEQVLNKKLSVGREGSPLQFSGILCVGQQFLLFRQGEQEIILLNTRNCRVSSSALTIQQGNAGNVYFQSGAIQKGVGILLATKSFYASTPRNALEECLDVREMGTQEQAESRLRELGHFAEAQGGEHMGAILIVTG